MDGVAERCIPLLAEEGWRDSLIEAGAPGAKREPGRAKLQFMVSAAKSTGCLSDHPVCAASVASRHFISGAASPPLRGGECSVNHHDHFAHLHDLSGLAANFRNAACLRCIKRGFHLHGFHERNDLLFRNHIAYGNLEAQEFARHQGLDLIGRGSKRCCSGETRLAGALEMIRVSIEPDGIGVAITYGVKANTAAEDFNRIAVEKAKGNCLHGDVERGSAL